MSEKTNLSRGEPKVADPHRENNSKALSPFKSVNDLKVALAGEYRKQIENYFGDNQKALEFLSGVAAAVQRLPKLLECEPGSVINSFITMAQLRLMPSNVSGEAYVLPYKGVAQFQLGYQGLVTLFYRAGCRSITAEIVYENDEFSYENGEVRHRADPFNDNRGEPKGAYVIIELQSGGKVSKAMSKKEILEIGEGFSQSYKSEYSPWNPKNDPQLWMWRKTVLKQSAKLVPKNETIYKAIEADNRDSIIAERRTAIENKGPKDDRSGVLILLRNLGHHLQSSDEIADKVLELTGLTLEDGNISEIRSRLQVLVDEKKEAEHENS